ncbi:hypothetical protein [Pseudobacteroides cellulosolvens]|uniref:Deacetylase PdaC domain-containing protein n=1 Tax=Pseudobacteroides cellulosolvens ATCC 35603 = DSM 2933 TaxID=398512 RepID=A0A0L6JQ19_9FIRM|nr:hypothetical protein [Pseudobacteroides cellulosolvens]KNY27928.1 hypothetical protein Bccel_3199 [Pseudobacteroides cellulosolvens ATCC 35603 = DSM 2933]KNY27936.1 hypothetical protein Bccel_3207 [Pseudobacteroides cellulosolvens ATCC 35603 = DSM 2933]
MIRKICLLLVMAMLLVLISCNKFGNEKPSIISINKQFPLKNNKSSNIVFSVADSVYNNREINITYPQIKKLEDESRQNSINDLLRKEAFTVLDLFRYQDDITIKINYKITRKSNYILSVTYDGYARPRRTYPSRLFYTVNIDINSGRKIELKDYINIDKSFINKFRNYEVREPEMNQASASAFDYILKSYSDEDLIRCFNTADSSYAKSPFAFSYLTNDSLGISMEAPHVAGGHIEIELKYTNIKDNIETNKHAYMESY